MKILFLDESGDHNLSTVDPQYPLFVLGGVIMEQDIAERVLPQRFSIFKRKHFGRDDIILHTADMVRNRNGFERMIEADFRNAVYDDLNDMLRGLDFMVVACSIRKDIHLAKYGLAALDPYLMSMDVIVERFCFELGGQGRGVILAERRDPTLDRELELAWLNLKIQGTKYIKAKHVDARVQSLNLRSKSENIAGLQLADLVVTPIGRHVLGKKEKEDFRVVRDKFRMNTMGEYRGFGLVVLPK